MKSKATREPRESKCRSWLRAHGSIVVGADTLRAGIDLGATIIDSAEAYGTESLVGHAIRGIRHRIFLASEVAPRHFRRADVIKAAECTLRLRTDYLDLYPIALAQ